MARKPFDKQIADRLARYRQENMAIARESVQRVISEAQKPVGAGGNMPINTGFLRASFRSSIGASIGGPISAPPRTGPVTQRRFDYETANFLASLIGWDFKDRLRVGWTANYARYVEGKTAFMRLAIQNWPRIVDGVTREVRGGRR